MASKFAHLHVHSEFSLLEGACRFEALLNKVKALGMNAVALTDFGNLFGSLTFYEKAINLQIKPILGCEVFVTRNRFEKATQGIRDPMYRLILLAENNQGFANLRRISTIGYMEGFYYRPRIDREILNQYKEGLIAIACHDGGEITRNYLDRNLDSVDLSIQNYLKLFGENNFFLEIVRVGNEHEEEINGWLLQKSKKSGVALVATNDCYYVNAEDCILQEIVSCIQTGHTLHDDKRRRLETKEHFIKSQEDMGQLFADIPEVIDVVTQIVNRCSVEFRFGKTYVPTYDDEQGRSPEQLLKELCEQGLIIRYGEHPASSIVERMHTELKIINDMKFVSYFLIVWDFIHFALKNNIPVGPGRGSAAGSLVAYLLHITDIDPLSYQLIFERFLNPDRISMPDIDIDFSDDDRGKMIEYVTKKYGKDHVAQICTFGTMGAKAAVRDVGRVLGMNYADVDRIAKLIPNEIKITLDTALDMEPELKKIYENDSQIKQLIDYAKALEGTSRNLSIHAAGIVIGSEPLVAHIPLCTGSHGEVATQYSMGQVEQLGLLKMDFLGLRTLKVIQEAIVNIRLTQQTEIDISRIPINDKKTLELINSGKTVGVFQLESAGMRDLARKMGIDRFDDLIALVALYRPGPMHMAEEYIKRKKGEITIKYTHPKMENILKDTYGIMLYQEQVMQVASALGGYSMAQADNLRRIMGKKIPEKMKKEKEVFVKGATMQSITQQVAEQIFEDMAYFAGYGFNKSHSAAYALISYRTAYLKANFSQEFMAALLSSELHNPDKLSEYLHEAKEMRISILSPDINESQNRFSVFGDHIRFGLSAIKNVGGGMVDYIIEERKKCGPYTSFKNFVERSSAKVMNRKTIESLIYCGTFDSLKHRRSQLDQALDQYLEAASKLKRESESSQTSFFDTMIEADSHDSLTGVWQLPDVEEWSDEKKFKHEKELLGFYLTGHPLNRWKEEFRKIAVEDIASLSNKKDGEMLVVGAVIAKVTIRLTRKKNEKMAILVISDLQGSIEAVCFPKTFERVNKSIIEDAVMIITGRLDLRESQPKIIVEDLMPVHERLGKFVKEIVLHLDMQKFGTDIIDNLKNLLRQHTGNCPVKLKCLKNAAEYVMVTMDRQFWVTPTDELFSEVENILGINSIQYAKRMEIAS